MPRHAPFKGTLDWFWTVFPCISHSGGRSVSSTILANALCSQLKQPSFFCHPLMLTSMDGGRTTKRGVGCNFFLCLSAGIITTAHTLLGELKRVFLSARKTSQLGHYGLLHICKHVVRIGAFVHVWGCHSRTIRASRSWQVVFVLQLLTCANFNQVTMLQF